MRAKKRNLSVIDVYLSVGVPPYTFAGELKIIPNKVHTGSGTISTLINDTASANNLKRSLVNIDSSARKLPALMEALKHNFLFKHILRSRRNKTKSSFTGTFTHHHIR
ncbi:MAG: hypothetical protein KIS94_02080 [Chitinophagales bacterium]|nr:hypothetical protein [Chitinophagales bacterium]